MKRALLAVLSLVLLSAVLAAQTHTFAALDLANTWTNTQTFNATPSVLYNAYFDFTKTAAPANPDGAHVRLYADTGSGNFTCLTSAGTSCFGLVVSSVFGRTGAITATTNDYNFNQLAGTATKAQSPATTVFNDQVNTFGSGGTADFSAASATAGLKVPIAAGATPTASGTLAYDSTANQLKYGANGSTVTLMQSASPFQAPVTATLGSDVTIATSSTTILSQAINMPSSGGPFRVMVAYNLNTILGTSGICDAWVSDATNKMAGSQSGNSSGAGSATTGQNSFQISPVTYANSAAVTFTLTGICSVSSTAKAAGSQTGSMSTYLNLTVYASS